VGLFVFFVFLGGETLSHVIWTWRAGFLCCAVGSRNGFLANQWLTLFRL
jgi:hypothetical protein